MDPAAAGSSSFNATDTRTMILRKVTSLVREGTNCVSEALYKLPVFCGTKDDIDHTLMHGDDRDGALGRQRRIRSDEAAMSELKRDFAWTDIATYHSLGDFSGTVTVFKW